MILYYALGGGLGHLVRARAVAHTLGIEDRMTVLSGSVHADDPRVTGPLHVRRVPLRLERDPVGCRDWLIQIMRELQPEELFLDTFPAGILGELAGRGFPADVRMRHVARLVRREVLAELFGPAGPTFETCYMLEELGTEHCERLAARAGSVERLELTDPPCVSPGDDAAQQLAATIESRHAAFWLVVHSGPAEEVGELLRLATDMRSMENVEVDFVVLTRVPIAAVPARTFVHDLHPAALLFRSAQRIISAGGFNTLRQATPWRGKHVILPFARRWDDQFERAARYRAR
jgi:hypothetical protein